MKTYVGARLLSKIQSLVILMLTVVNTPVKALFDENKQNESPATAVIKDPIIDMRNSYPAPDNPPASPEDKRCNRAHQGLYNELVNCIEEDGDQIKISFNNIVYGFDNFTKKAENTFWIYKKHIAPLQQLKSELIKAIPNINYAVEPTIVLVYPWKEFSVGTRFKHLPKQDTQNAYAIERIDYISNSILSDLVPMESAILEVKQDSQSARKLFVKIINDLIDRVAQSGQNHVIPYIWGGSSFVEPCIESNFYKQDGTWHRDGKCNPYSGYDCAEFIMRMAQIAGLDFPWKTTAAIERSSRALDKKDQLEEGDLIWIQGHIMIVSNIKHNEIIESRGYSSGYGCVHRSTLDKCFADINTYNDLLERYYNNQTIRFKDKQGTTKKAEVFKLLKLID